MDFRIFLCIVLCHKVNTTLHGVVCGLSGNTRLHECLLTYREGTYTDLQISSNNTPNGAIDGWIIHERGMLHNARCLIRCRGCVTFKVYKGLGLTHLEQKRESLIGAKAGCHITITLMLLQRGIVA